MPKRWSTKTLEIVEPPRPKKSGIGMLEFTDDYSVFHYSKMPDRIPDKGEALCRMAVSTLRAVEAAGIPTHFRRFIAPKRMEIDLLRVLDHAAGELDWGDKARIVPLQFICRNQLPQGASVFRRLAAGTVSLADLGLDALPGIGQRLKPPLIEFTTKLEEIDRFISRAEAMEIARLDGEQMAAAETLVRQVNEVVTARAEQLGLVHADSKVELGIDGDGELMLIDTAGTPDENRFVINNFHVTKQILRNFYLSRGLEEDVQKWAAEGRPRSTWPVPERLPAELIEATADMNRALAERWTGEKIWGAPPLEEVVSRLGELQQKFPVAS